MRIDKRPGKISCGLAFLQTRSSLKTSECEGGDSLAIVWLEVSKTSMNGKLTQHLKTKN